MRTACKPEWISQFIHDDLDDGQLLQLEQHLSVCELCQSRFNEQLSSLDVQRSLDHLRTEADQHATTHQDSTQQALLTNFAKRFFPAPDNSQLLGRIGQLELVEPIGSGGMGLVYKAFDRSLHRYVALKVLSPALATTGAAKQRFIREAQTAAAIHSPYVIPIHSVSEIDGLPYIVMHFATGVNLQEHINASGPLSILSAIKVAHQIAQGLFAAHQQGIIHRDVKPANIILEPSVMRAALTDFGLALVADDASLTHSGMTPGTPSYMSPEQASGSIVDHRSDWYSFGCVLYTMLVGHPPFRGHHAFEVLTRLQREEPKPPSHHRREIPSWLDKLVMMLLTKRAELRLADGERIVNLLNDVQQHIENPAQNALPMELQTRKNVRKRIWIALLLAIAMRVGFMLPSEMTTARSVSQVVLSNESNSTQHARESATEPLVALRQPSEIALRQAAQLQLELLRMQDEQSWSSMRELDDDITSSEMMP